MFENDNQTPDFSDIPALGDTQGLENYMNNQALAAQGLAPAQPAPQANPVASTENASAQPADPTATAQPQQPAAQPAQQPETITLTKEQLNALLASRQVVQPQAPVQPQPQAQPRTNGYTAQEQTFIANALAKGYTLEQINRYLMSQKQPNVNPAMEQRIAQVEQYLQTKEYQEAQTQFINKLTDFGNKWGLTEQDLITFGNEALKQGINIAAENVNLETVFRAVYPQQYALRSRRMTPTNFSQIYGGVSVPENSNVAAKKMEDAYVERFLQGAMPNQYAAAMKK